MLPIFRQSTLSILVLNKCDYLQLVVFTLWPRPVSLRLLFLRPHCAETSAERDTDGVITNTNVGGVR